MVKKIAIRVLLLCLIILVSDMIYRVCFFTADFKNYSPQLFEIQNSSDSTDVYYFGESSNTSFVYEDSSYKSISALTAQHFPQLYFRNINKEATHAGIYLRWLEYLGKQNKLPKAVVVTMNLRSFNAAWVHSELENSLQEALVMGYPCLPVINRFLLALQAFSHKTMAESEQLTLKDWASEPLNLPDSGAFKSVKDWDAKMADGGYLNEDGTWNQKKIELACHYIKAYALNITPQNKRVQDFDNIQHWCAKNHVNLYLNLMAENVDYADSLVGKDLVFLMRRNRDFLVNRYNTGNCKVVDNLETVSGDLFIDQHWTTEHYKIKGRLRIANNLAKAISKDFETTVKN